MRSILVKDFMDRNPHAINQNTPVRSAVVMLVKEQISGAPVVDEDNNLVGFISEQDCIQEVLNDAFYCEESPSVLAVMSKTVITVSPETSIVEIAEAMGKRPPKNYPVEENGKLIGLISRRLILKALIESNEDCFLHTK